MKIPVYDYRKLEGGRPARIMWDVPPELEDPAMIWKRNDWVVGCVQVPEDKGPVDTSNLFVYVCAIDFMSDVILHKVKTDYDEAGGPHGFLRGVTQLLLTDPAVITAEQRRAIKEGGEAVFPDTTEES